MSINCCYVSHFEDLVMSRMVVGTLAGLVLSGLSAAQAAEPHSGFGSLEMDVMEANDGPAQAIKRMDKRRRAAAARRSGTGAAPDVHRGLDDRLSSRTPPVAAPPQVATDAFAPADRQRDFTEHEHDEGHGNGQGKHGH
jgi:hypothetical protein